MPIENRNLEPGTVLTARYKQRDRTCEVVKTEEGLSYRLDDGTEHNSPSSAGKAAMGGVACNGWRFWSIAGTEKPKREQKAKTEKPTKAPAKKKAGRKSPKTKGKASRMASGASYGCGVCAETFPTMKAATQHALTHTS